MSASLVTMRDPPAAGGSPAAKSLK